MLKLVDVGLGFFQAFAGEDAFALVMDLEHVIFGFLLLPAKNHLEDVRHVLHEIYRIIPANNQVTRIEAGLWVRFFRCLEVGQNFRRRSFCHEGKIEEERRIFQCGIRDCQ